MEFVNIKENEIEVVRGDRPYKEREGGVARHSLRYILGDLRDIKQKYFILGFHLNEFVQNEYYKDFGFDSMKDFCLANIPIEYSSLSRCMSVHAFACERLIGNNSVVKTNRMLEEYKEYSYSQLVEMIGTTIEERKRFTPDMTVKEMREIKKQIKDKQKGGQTEKSDSCDVATMENENNSAEKATTELSKSENEKSIKAFDIDMACKRFICRPSDFLADMFKRKFGDDLPVTARGKMLEMKIPNYEVTIRISFKEIE